MQRGALRWVGKVAHLWSKEGCDGVPDATVWSACTSISRVTKISFSARRLAAAREATWEVILKTPRATSPASPAPQTSRASMGLMSREFMLEGKMCSGARRTRAGLMIEDGHQQRGGGGGSAGEGAHGGAM